MMKMKFMINIVMTGTKKTILDHNIKSYKTINKIYSSLDAFLTIHNWHEYFKKNIGLISF